MLFEGVSEYFVNYLMKSEPNENGKMIRFSDTYLYI